MRLIELFFRRSSACADVTAAFSRLKGLQLASATARRFVFQTADHQTNRSSRRPRAEAPRKPDVRGCDVGIAVTTTCA